MSFSENHSAFLEESYYSTVLPNGLAVYVYPMPHKSGIYAMLSAGIGSVTRDFTLGGREVQVPAGVAHFLEHKVFENEEGDAFTLFAKTGAYANAYTSFDRTCYLFSATINMEASLRTLIRFVNSPHFTKENIEKEQGIIAQEIKMYDDSADWVLTNMVLGNLYHKHSLRDDIAGTVESISEITAETLYDCYNAFYRPANMVLAVAGNISPQMVLDICDKEYAQVPAPTQTVSLAKAEEPDAIVRAKSERQMAVFENQFGLGYKAKPFDKATAVKDGIVLRILLELLVGDTSVLYRSLYDAGLANSMLDAGAVSGDDYLCVLFSGESAKPDTVVEDIRKEIDRQRENGIDVARFEECKRALVGSELCAFDSTEAVATKMTVGHFKDFALYDIIDVVNGITVSDVQDMLHRILDNKNSTVAVIRPQREQE